ncbi:hypothetical protein QTP88_027720 [Uroleucon formosanum]
MCSASFIRPPHDLQFGISNKSVQLCLDKNRTYHQELDRDNPLPRGLSLVLAAASTRQWLFPPHILAAIPAPHILIDLQANPIWTNIFVNIRERIEELECHRIHNEETDCGIDNIILENGIVFQIIFIPSKKCQFHC